MGLDPLDPSLYKRLRYFIVKSVQIMAMAKKFAALIDGERVYSLTAANIEDARAMLADDFDSVELLRDNFRDRWIADGSVVQEVDK
jgi:hypothetical protein